MSELSHLNADGNPHMVDVGDKAVTKRVAKAQSTVILPPASLTIFTEQAGETKKGNVFQVARLAGIMAAKECSRLIPLCHPLQINNVDIEIERQDAELCITAEVSCTGKTGVEMEALTAASVTALTIYDMLKALSHEMIISETRLLQKTGGKSGDIDLTSP